MAQTEEEIQSLLSKERRYKKGEDLPEEEIQREYPKDSPSGRS
jgi:hypothetical protein